MEIQQRTHTMTIRPTTQPNIISPVACTQEGTPSFLTHRKKMERTAASPPPCRRHAAGDAALLSPSSTVGCRASLFSAHRGQMLCDACPHHLGHRGAVLLGRRRRRGARTRFGVGTGEGVRAQGVAPPREEPPVLSSPNNHGGRATTSREGK